MTAEELDSVMVGTRAERGDLSSLSIEQFTTIESVLRSLPEMSTAWATDGVVTGALVGGCTAKRREVRRSCNIVRKDSGEWRRPSGFQGRGSQSSSAESVPVVWTLPGANSVVCSDHRVTEIGSSSITRIRGTVGTEISTSDGRPRDWVPGEVKVGVRVRLTNKTGEHLV